MTTITLTKDKMLDFFKLVKHDIDLGYNINVEINYKEFDDDIVLNRKQKESKESYISFSDSLSILGINENEL